VFFNLEEWATYIHIGYSGDSRPEEAFPEALETFMMLCVMNAASVLGRLSSSYLGDRVANRGGALLVHTVVTFVASLLCLALWPVAKSVGSAITFTTLFGAFSGAVIALPAAGCAFIYDHAERLHLERYGMTRRNKLGQWIGMMYFTAGFTALAGSLIVGALIQRFATYLTAQLWSGICLFISSICMGFATWKLEFPIWRIGTQMDQSPPTGAMEKLEKDGSQQSGTSYYDNEQITRQQSEKQLSENQQSKDSARTDDAGSQVV
jgi:MFS transporter, MCT family, solute carrier family 16 (monocarboxylic acid transporters), member 10